MKPNFTQKVTNWGNFPVVEKEMRSEDSFKNIKNSSSATMKLLPEETEGAMEMLHWEKAYFLPKN